MKRNFFIFLTKESNFPICMEHLLYGADVSRNDQRSLGNVKPGDLALIWVPETKLLYGVLEIQNRIFYDETDIGWTKLWPYRCGIKLWDGFLRTIKDEQKARLMSFVSRELVTLNDLTNLGGYIHSLLYNEGTKLLRFFLANSEMEVPSSVFPEFGSHATVFPIRFDFASRLSSDMAEYKLERYLLQYHQKLEELVGPGISELYNMLFGYQRRYLDIMTIHVDEDGNPFKTTVIELKTSLTQRSMERALDELASYMFWISDQTKKGKMAGSADSVFGTLVSKQSSAALRNVFSEKREVYSSQYGIPQNKMHYASYEVVQGVLNFKLEI